MSSLLGWTAVGLLAAIGAVARFALDAAISRRVRSSFPWGILAVNGSGSFALGALAGAGGSGWTLRLAGAALLGSYTTFSSWIVDSGRMGEQGDVAWAWSNIAGSIALGIGAVALGWAAGGLL